MSYCCVFIRSGGCRQHECSSYPKPWYTCILSGRLLALTMRNGYAGINHAASGFATGVAIGWNGGLASALTNGAFFGAMSGYLSTTDKPAAAASALRAPTATCSTPLRHGLLQKSSCCCVGLQELRPGAGGGPWKLLGCLASKLAAVVHAHDTCTCCAPCTGAMTACTGAMVGCKKPGIYCGTVVLKKLVVGRQPGLHARSGIMVTTAMQQRAERLQLAKLDLVSH
jgi:hypothetical protein